MSRLAVIDLGTNSVRFDVHEISRTGVIRRLHREKLMVRLGEEVFLTGRLNPDAEERTLRAFQGFAKTIRLLEVDEVAAFATSAVREASDGVRLIQRILKKTKIEIRVLSGKEEALWIARGILKNEVSAKGEVALVDIGGGSAEITICKKRKILSSQSFELGGARIQQVFLKSIPPRKATARTPDPVQQTRAYAQELLEKDWPKVKRIVGSSGTIRALVKIHRRIHGVQAPFNLPALSKLVKKMRSLTDLQLLRIPGMEPNRVDLILAGAIVLEEIAKALRVKEIVATDFSLRDGILEEELKKIKVTQARANTTKSQQQIQVELLKKVKTLGVNEKHTLQVLKITELLFDRLQKLHRLDREWREILQIAAILHDSGHAISPVQHEVHSEYVARHTLRERLPSWKVDVIADLCRWHKTDKFKASEIKLIAESRRLGFLRALAILQVADALDRGHHNHVRIRNIRIKGREVSLRIDRAPPSELELLRVEVKKELFEKVFRRSLRVYRS